jgi:hypothetical protein
MDIERRKTTLQTPITAMRRPTVGPARDALLTYSRKPIVPLTAFSSTSSLDITSTLSYLNVNSHPKGAKGARYRMTY